MTTQEKTEILVSSKLCHPTPKEDLFRDGLLIDLPEDSKFAGYQMYISYYFVHLPRSAVRSARYYCITKGKQDYIYELYKKEREQGKRYPRYKLTFDELFDVFAAHSAQFRVSASLPYVLACCKDYANNGTRMAGAVLGRSYYVGQVDEVWLYINNGDGDIERRRLNSRGVEIIRYLSSEDVEPTKQMLCKKTALYKRKNGIASCRVEISNWKRSQQKEHLSESTFYEIQKRLKEIDTLIDADTKVIEQELAQVEKFIKGE